MALEGEKFRTELDPLITSLQHYGPAEAAMRARALADLASQLDTDSLLNLLTDITTSLRAKLPKKPRRARMSYLPMGQAPLAG